MLSQGGCYSGLLEAQPVEVDSNLSQQFIFNMFKALTNGTAKTAGSVDQKQTKATPHSRVKRGRTNTDTKQEEKKDPELLVAETVEQAPAPASVWGSCACCAVRARPFRAEICARVGDDGPSPAAVHRYPMDIHTKSA